jgi:hypothetical protein
MTDTIQPSQPLGADDKPIPLPDAGIVSSVEMDRRRGLEGVAHLEAMGFPERGTPVGDDLHNLIEGRSPVTPELQKQAENKLASFERDAEWRRRFYAGDARTVREFHLATGIIAAGKIQRRQGLD